MIVKGGLKNKEGARFESPHNEDLITFGSTLVPPFLGLFWGLLFTELPAKTGFKTCRGNFTQALKHRV